MVCEWGMTDALGAVSYDERSDQGQYLGISHYEKSYSEETAKAIDDEVRKIVDAAHKQATEIIESHREKVLIMTDMLMEFETLDRQDVLDIMDGKWDINKKRQRLKSEADRAKKEPPPPPNPITDTPTSGNVDFKDPSPQGT
jgi:cell division protease FtsH